MGDNGLLSPVFESTKVLSNLKKSRSLQYSSQLSVKLIWGYSFNGSERWPVKPMVVGSNPSIPAIVKVRKSLYNLDGKKVNNQRGLRKSSWS